LTEGDVSDGTRPGQDTKTRIPFTAEAGDGVDDVDSAREFEYVGAHNGFGVPGKDDGWFGFVLGSGWAASGAADDFDGGAVGGCGRVFLVGGGRAVGFLGVGVCELKVVVVVGGGEVRRRVLVVEFGEEVGIAILVFHEFSFHDD
jgi:hypothetical protein